MEEPLKDQLESSLTEQRVRLAEVDRELFKLGNKLTELKVEKRGLEGNIKHEDKMLRNIRKE